MKHRLATIAFVLATILLGATVSGAYWQSRQQYVIAGASGCSEATAFLARVSSPSGSDTTNYTNLICGMVTDGTYTNSWGFLYILAAKDITTAILDLSPNARDGTDVSSTFTAYQGSAGTDALSSAAYITSPYNASTTGPCTQNDCSEVAWVNTNVNDNSATGGHVMGGGYDGTGGYSGINARSSDTMSFRVNDTASGPSATIANTNAAGFYAAVRTGASTQFGYKNATSQGVGAVTSASIPNAQAGCLTIRDIIASGWRYGSGNQLSICGMGRGFSGAEITSLYSRFGTYRTAVGL